MYRNLVCIIILIVTLLTVHMPVCGQQPELSDEAKIKLLRVNLQRLVENAPPKDAPDQGDYRRTLVTLRRQLQRLLVEKSGALKSRIRNLDMPDAVPEVAAHVQQLGNELRAVNDEIAQLDRSSEGDSTVVPFGSTPSPSPSPTSESVDSDDTTRQAVEAKRADFEQAVRNLVADSEKLKDAAAPKAAEDVSQPAACDENGIPTAAKPSRYDGHICQLARDLTDEDRGILLEQDKGQLLPILIAKLLKTTGTESYVSMITEAQEQRIDQQIGAAPRTAGATSLVSKGGIPYLFGFAVENGAAVETRTGTTVTFRFNPAGVIKLFEKRGFLTGFREIQRDPVMHFLSKTSVGLSFDTDRGDQPGVFTGNRQQLSAVSARVEFLNERDPRHKKYATEWEEFVANDGVEYAKGVWAATIALERFGGRAGEDTFVDPALQAWLVASNQSLATVTGSDRLAKINSIAKLLRERADLLPVKLVTPETVQAITTFAKHLKDYQERKEQLLDKIARGKIFTLDYLNKREVNASDTSTFNFIAATGTGAKIDLTANGSFTFFHKRPTAGSLTSLPPGRFRDFQFAGQMTVPINVGESQFDFWFSGRYERLLEDVTTFAGSTIPNTKGDIAVGQFGFNIPIKSLGIKFPVSFTVANRTELVKEREIRGNFGFTFNWDTIFSKLKPF